MTDLVEFLRARLDEDELAALAAKGKTLGCWEDKSDPVSWITLVDKSGKLTMGEHRHIARHDPTRVLREVEAKRQIVDYERLGDLGSLGINAWGVWRDMLKLLAMPYADHPDYQQEWNLNLA